jgi:phosphoenolpyruvate carboxykinase (ATP)
VLSKASIYARQLQGFYAHTGIRCFAAPTQELLDNLKNKGITNKNIVHNPTVAELYEYALQPEHIGSCDPNIYNTTIVDNGALSCSSGMRMGRSPKDKRVVLDETTKDDIWWGSVNIPMDPKGYARNKRRVVDFLNIRPRLFVIDGYAGWDPTYRLKCRVVAARPYHAIFMKTMMIRDTNENLNKSFASGNDFLIMNAGEFGADPTTENVTNPTSVAVNFKDQELAILGSGYAGEMKKGLFGIMHYYMPKKFNVLSMHASANEGPKGDTTVLFGLSGTGKTTLSADPKRRLIGDDEHVWTDKGIFNIEGGCYAKCINLSAENEPDIFNAIKFGAIIENMKYFPDRPRTLNFDDVSLTENTRTAYPLEHIPNVKLPAVGGHPKNIIFLTCDANGVLPPVAKLTKEQIMYHFISGYTAKVAGTEVGITDPVPSFSACFGEAFLPLHPFTYAKMLADMVEKYKTNVWLMNTGWSGGKYGVGKRMSIKVTRGLLDTIHDGRLEKCEFVKMPGFNLNIPKAVEGIDSSILNPKNTWSDKAAYDDQARKLAQQFIKNMNKYADGTPKEVMEKGGPAASF